MNSVKEAIKNARENAKRTSTIIRTMGSVTKVIVNKMVKVGLTPDISFDSHSPNIWVAGTKDDLVKLFRVMRAEGFAPRSAPQERVTYYSSLWTRGEDEHLQKIYVTFSSTTCKQVQVGTKLVEQPVYEVQCE